MTLVLINVNDRIIITPSTKDYVNGDDDPDDENGHGTSVAGVIVESTPANVKIYPSKVFDATGKTDSTGLTNVLTAITNAVNEDKVDIINLSLGFDSEDESDIIKCSDYSAVENFFTQVKNAGVLTIAAAGNESHAVSFPANCTDVIAVSSVKSDRTFSSDFSNFGPEIDFAMPGERLYLPTIIKAGEAVPDPSINSNNALRQISGTSFSSPFLASAAALIKAENPNYTPAQLIAALKSYAVSLGEANKYGNGIVDFGEKMFKNARVYMKSEKTVGSSSDNLWTKSGTIKVAAVSSSPITKYAFGKTEAALLNSSNIHNVTGTQYTLPVTDITVTEAHRYYFGVTNATSTSTAYVDVGNIDNTAPTFESQITFSNAGANKITVSVYALDSQSGIKKYSIYYRKKGTTTYENKSFAYALVGNAGTTSQVLASFNLTNLEDATEYEFYFEVEDAVGNKRTTALATFTTQTTDPIQLPDAGGNENQQPQNPDPEAVRTSASNPVTVDPIIIYFSGFVGSTMLGFAIYRTIGGRR